MKASITIAMNNAAFSENAGEELARILREAAGRVEHIMDFDSREPVGNYDLTLMDADGYRAGKLIIR